MIGIDFAKKKIQPRTLAHDLIQHKSFFAVIFVLDYTNMEGHI